MHKIVISITLIMLASGTAFAADKSKANKQKKQVEAPEAWYGYRFVESSGHRVQTSQCKKSDVSPAEVAEYRDRYGINYEIAEQLTRKGKPVIVDIQSVDVRNIGYDYTSGGTPRSYYTVTNIIIDRFIRGEKLCNEIRELDTSGELEKQKLDRYR